MALSEMLHNIMRQKNDSRNSGGTVRLKETNSKKKKEKKGKKGKKGKKEKKEKKEK